MKHPTAYNFKTRKTCKIIKPKLVTLKTGRKAIQGFADDDQKTKVFRIVSDTQAKEFRQTHS